MTFSSPRGWGPGGAERLTAHGAVDLQGEGTSPSKALCPSGHVLWLPLRVAAPSSSLKYTAA